MTDQEQLQAEIDSFVSSTPNPSGINFPDAKTIVAQRLKAQGYSDESIKTIPDNSPIMLSTKQEIESAKMLANHVVNQIPLLIVPITAPIAIQVVYSHLPALLTALQALGIEPTVIEGATVT